MNYQLPPLSPLAGLLLAACVWFGWKRYRRRKSSNPSNNAGSEQSYDDIEPLRDFDWKSVEPIQIRPFKSTFHLTMALQSCTLSDLVAMDKTYHERIQLRRKLISNATKNVVDCNPVAADAVREIYEWIFGTYLPKRFPTMFSLVPSEVTPTTKGTPHGYYLLNHITNEHIPTTAPPDPLQALKTLGSHVDDEFLILLPTSNPNAAPFRASPAPVPGKTPYHLHAYILAFPSGFNTPQKLGLPLAGIHAPVPGYGAKLEKSMDRFFAALGFGKVVRRQNWAVQTDGNVFKLEGNHLSVFSPSSSPLPPSSSSSSSSPEGSELEKTTTPTMTISPYTMAPATHTPSRSEILAWEKAAEAVRPEQCHLRCERQTLHRLEKTGAVVFAFKTYMYPLSAVKREGGGGEMADAIEGMWRGSVPGMTVYKRAVIWGEKVVKYLRGEGE